MKPKPLYHPTKLTTVRESKQFVQLLEAIVSLESYIATEKRLFEFTKNRANFNPHVRPEVDRDSWNAYESKTLARIQEYENQLNFYRTEAVEFVSPNKTINPHPLDPHDPTS